jgi:hypothetical protein
VRPEQCRRNRDREPRLVRRGDDEHDQHVGSGVGISAAQVGEGCRTDGKRDDDESAAPELRPGGRSGETAHDDDRNPDQADGATRAGDRQPGERHGMQRHETQDEPVPTLELGGVERSRSWQPGR